MFSILVFSLFQLLSFCDWCLRQMVGGGGGKRGRILKMSIKSCWTGERQTTGQEDAGMDWN